MIVQEVGTACQKCALCGENFSWLHVVTIKIDMKYKKILICSHCFQILLNLRELWGDEE